MRLLLDECLPRRLRQSLGAHEVRTVQEMGWAGVKNGELLRNAAGAFDVFITIDQGIEYQQNLISLELAIVVLRAQSNDIAALLPLVPSLLAVIATAEPGRLLEVDA